ncbi:MAG: rhamnan synthesis F family protein [Legionella sp.]|jgi:lipopolysaccharide biosynthesis protein
MRCQKLLEKFKEKILIYKYPRRIIKFVWYLVSFRLFTVINNYGGLKAIAKFLLSPENHISPLLNDYSLVVPFNYSAHTFNPSIAVICHLFYVELSHEISSYLANIPYGFDLYITTDTPQKKLYIENTFAAWNKGTLEVRLAPNRGRDIAPKIVTCKDVYSAYEFVLHIHTKKSPHLMVNNGWNTYILDTLLGSKEIVASILEAFNQDERLGMIAPQHYSKIRACVGWSYNIKMAKKFLKRQLKIPFLDAIDFPSGSMFWARTAALKPLLKLNLKVEQFAKEKGQLDGTLAHVIERVYFLVCEKAGFKWIKIASRAKEEALIRSIDIEDQKQLVWAIQQVQK